MEGRFPFLLIRIEFLYVLRLIHTGNTIHYAGVAFRAEIIITQFYYIAHTVPGEYIPTLSMIKISFLEP